jgi:hypothetical protein
LVKSYDNGIKENYKIIMSEKYAAVRDKYKDVVKPLLDIAYPDFVKEIIAHLEQYLLSIALYVKDVNTSELSYNYFQSHCLST